MSRTTTNKPIINMSRHVHKQNINMSRHVNLGSSRDTGNPNLGKSEKERCRHRVTFQKRVMMSNESLINFINDLGRMRRNHDAMCTYGISQLEFENQIQRGLREHHEAALSAIAPGTTTDRKYKMENPQARPCYKFSNQGVCDYETEHGAGTCCYSHNSEIIAKDRREWGARKHMRSTCQPQTYRRHVSFGRHIKRKLCQNCKREHDGHCPKDNTSISTFSGRKRFFNSSKERAHAAVEAVFENLHEEEHSRENPGKIPPEPAETNGIQQDNTETEMEWVNTLEGLGADQASGAADSTQIDSTNPENSAHSTSRMSEINPMAAIFTMLSIPFLIGQKTWKYVLVALVFYRIGELFGSTEAVNYVAYNEGNICSIAVHNVCYMYLPGASHYLIPVPHLGKRGPGVRTIQHEDLITKPRLPSSPHSLTYSCEAWSMPVQLMPLINDV
jgi:hypothetical protein